MTGKPKSSEEVQAAHDKIHLAISRIEFTNPLEKAAFVGAMNVLCWVLGHEDVDSGGEAFQNNLLNLEFQLMEMGITFKDKEGGGNGEA